MSDVDELIRRALRVKRLEEQLDVAKQELAAAAARHRGGRPRSSKMRAARNGKRAKAVAKDVRPKVVTQAAPTSVSGRVREHLRTNATKTYDSAGLIAEMKLPTKELLNVRALLKKLTKQQLVVRVDRGQYRWKA